MINDQKMTNDENLRSGDDRLRRLAKERARDWESMTDEDRIAFVDDLIHARFGDIDEQNVLLDGEADVAIAVNVGELRHFAELRRCNAAAQDWRANVIKPALFLPVDTEMIAVNVGGNLFRRGRIECKSDLALQFGKEAFGGPAVLEKEIL